MKPRSSRYGRAQYTKYEPKRRRTPTINATRYASVDVVTTNCTDCGWPLNKAPGSPVTTPNGARHYRCPSLADRRRFRAEAAQAAQEQS